MTSRRHNDGFVSLGILGTRSDDDHSVQLWNEQVSGVRPGSSEKGVVVEEVGLNQCDGYCQHCFWVFSFSSGEAQPVDCRSIPDIPNAFSVEDGF